MQDNKLKAELFAKLSAELQSEGATESNTDVIEADSIPSFPGPFSKLLPKVGGRFVTLVGKWVGLGFILYVTWVQSVPVNAPIYVPSDSHFVVSAAHHESPPIDLSQIDVSGSADLWISAYGVNRSVEPPKQAEPYIPCVGDKIRYMRPGSSPPTNYFQAVTGSFFG